MDARYVSFYGVGPACIEYRALYNYTNISVWARTTKRGVSLPVSGQRLTVFFGKLIMSRTQNDVIAVWIL